MSAAREFMRVTPFTNKWGQQAWRITRQINVGAYEVKVTRRWIRRYTHWPTVQQAMVRWGSRPVHFTIEKATQWRKRGTYGGRSDTAA